MDDQRSFLRDLAALAGVSLAPDREDALLSGLEGTRRIAEALSLRDFGETDSAGHFRAPKPQTR